MKILAIDTSTMMSSITIMEDNRIIGDFSISQEETHSEMLVPLVKRMLEDLKINLSEIDVYAVAKGPGSFTGLRIGVASIKAMAQVFDKPIIGISTLEAMAFSILNDNKILSIIDARGKRYFTGLYQYVNGKLVCYFEDIIQENKLMQIVEENEKITIVGEAIGKLPDILKNSEKVVLAPASLNNAIGRNLCVIAKQRFKSGEIESYFDIAPNYLRKSQAEVNLINK
ncbi:tRNA (adenosine(37)-N6)-threonylcarbamoyltransferase complex dimerization subunit type 1 TsaB [Helcococcus ovis]|uniref:tRNA (adenosine(37)-N6)-threonylcarbamoyltransferase complex dimerization subunit type 1 TsaB n=1 Tax=Helcococcus ovis TaxID=72026 RepID=UPI00107018D6|nr:tRNA (adenosine(37)-N6)-threonylcarbamoyltransferase complex dimerization subunit type 1 TsaB [Helcococcus ovis]TFF66689.1 tRNA (adenosine(37)-N6)-threonylcarbamoyltransferase complex dimerization subunit type 1 TsaB [Helcococcus ovis]WNZ00757.1 tRNA (adenosine(37)-N6)-threonylcarbamoyltransferase complex dimerization subunit type 1 TsaB [Helcococcus ovis]